MSRLARIEKIFQAEERKTNLSLGRLARDHALFRSCMVEDMGKEWVEQVEREAGLIK